MVRVENGDRNLGILGTSLLQDVQSVHPRHIVTGLYYWGAGVVEGVRLRHPLFLLAVFGQTWDGAQNLIGVTFLDYSPKLVVTNLVYQATGFSGSTFVLKLLVNGVIVWYLTDVEAEMNHTRWWLMTFFIGAIGLPMGVRGSLRMMLGV